VYKDLEVDVWVDLACGDDELDELDHGLLVKILGRDELVFLGWRRVLTRISMTNTMLAKSERGAPRVSTVMFPGQSHISSGIRVLLGGVCGGSERADGGLTRMGAS